LVKARESRIDTVFKIHIIKDEKRSGAPLTQALFI
jgi:hypothetical protein